MKNILNRFRYEMSMIEKHQPRMNINHANSPEGIPLGHVAIKNQLYTHEIDIKNSASNFTPTEDEFLIKDSPKGMPVAHVTIENQLYTHENKKDYSFN